MKPLLFITGVILFAVLGYMAWQIGLQGMTPLDPAMLEEFERAEAQNFTEL
jgi:hypothetical protein